MLQEADDPLLDLREGRPDCPSPDLADTGLSGLALCLFGGDIPEGGMEPLTIVDVGEQVMPGGIPGWVASPLQRFTPSSSSPTTFDAAPRLCAEPIELAIFTPTDYGETTLTAQEII